MMGQEGVNDDVYLPVRHRSNQKALQVVHQSSILHFSRYQYRGYLDGWIWSFNPNNKMSEKELQDWIDEGPSPFLLPKRTHEHRSLADQVQWFRAEAEMQRWLEEVEIKLADFLRSIRSFQKMSQASQYCIHIISLSEYVIDVAQTW